MTSFSAGGDPDRASLGPPSERPPARGLQRKPASVRVPARGESVRIVPLAGNLFVCSGENGTCGCGWVEKRRLPVPNTDLGAWAERRQIGNRLQLTCSGGIGPCAAGNNARLQLHGRSIRLKILTNGG